MNKAAKSIAFLNQLNIQWPVSDELVIEWCKHLNGSVVIKNHQYRWIVFDDCSEINFADSNWLISDKDRIRFHDFPGKIQDIKSRYICIYDVNDSILCLKCMYKGAIFEPCNEHINANSHLW